METTEHVHEVEVVAETAIERRAGGLPSLSPDALALLAAAERQVDDDRQAYGKAASTRRAYDSTVAAYSRFCESVGLVEVARTGAAVRAWLNYLRTGETTGMEPRSPVRPSTLARHAYALVSEGFCSSQDVADVVRVERRKAAAEGRHGKRQAHALTTVEVWAMADAAAREGGVKGARDRALVLLGFALGWRRSELVALDVSDVEVRAHGVLVTLRGPSKSDQAAEQGRSVWVPAETDATARAYCPRSAFLAYLEAAGHETGPLFRGATRHGTLREGRLTGEAVADVLHKLAVEAGVHGQVTGHSLRAGFVSEAKRRGAPDHHVMRSTGHVTSAMLAVYARESSAEAAAISVLSAR